MQIQIFTIPIYNNDEELKEMNSFLLSQRVLEISENFVSNTKGTFWCYSVRYIKKTSSKGYNQFPRKAKVDYQTILDKVPTLC